MSIITLAPPRVSPKSSGPKPRERGFSLVEVVIAIGIIAFALISILGVMSMSMVVHKSSSDDSVFSIMTETALQEVRNYNTPANKFSAGETPYNFSKLGNLTASTPGYIYFDEDGQITADDYWKGLNGSTGTPTITTSGSSVQSTDVGDNLAGSIVTNPGNAGVLSLSAITPLPTGTYYTCAITTTQPTLANAATTTPSMYVIILTFTWPPNASVTTQNKRVIVTSISNNWN
jgi:Tfp pilus assembly protein PilV